MNSILNALENSPIQALIDSSSPDDVFSYGSSATDASSVERVVVGAKTALSSTHQLEIPKVGLLTGIVLRVKVKGNALTAAGALRSNPNIAILDFMEIRSSNRTVARCDQKFLSGLLSSMPDQKHKQYLNSVISPTAMPITVDTEIDLYVPFLFSLSADGYGDSSECNYRGCLDTKFVETLSLHYRLNAKEKWAGTVAEAELTVENADAIMYYRVFPEQIYRQIEERNFSSGPLQVISHTAFSEGSKAVGAADTTLTFPLNTNGLVTQTFIKLVQDDEESTTGVSTDAEKRITALKSEDIKKITLNGNGRQIFEIDGPELKTLFMNAGMKSSSTNEDYVLDYRVLKGYDYSGGISFRELAGAEIVIEFTALGDTGKCFINHSVVEVLSVNPANGRISVSLSS